MRTSRVTLADHVSVGGRNVSTLLFGTEESMKYGQGRQVPRARPSWELWVGPAAAAVLQSLTGGAWVTQSLGCLYSCSCAIREAAASGRPTSPTLSYILVAQTIFQ